MTYVAVRKDAISEIVADRQLQSTDFDVGLNFAKGILARSEFRVSNRLEVRPSNNGIFVIGNDSQEQHFILYDIEQLFGGVNSIDAPTFLLILQKTLRFAATYWSGGVLKKYEMVNPERTRGVIFPFPISQQTSKRVVIDLEPDAERMARRDRTGNFILAFKYSQSGANSNEEVSLANFRRFLADLDKLPRDDLVASEAKSQAPTISSFSAQSLDQLENKIDPHQNYEKWLYLLTNKQKDFVTKKLKSPRRVDGPAGSGKTVSLALAAIHAMRDATENNEEFDALFVTHSEASRRSIETILSSMDGNLYLGSQPAARRLQVVTLQGYCASLLKQDLSTTEFVDPDAYDAKQLQGMFVEEAIKIAEADFKAYSPFLSEEFREYFSSEELEYKSILVQHEISVVIKGRSKENLEIYKKIPPIPNALPICSAADKGFVWKIYEEYRKQLIVGGQFDTDDVVLTALSQLATPIWRRRRVRDGFDALFVDETHLFNMNELSVFHHLTKSDTAFPIAFAVDRGQAIGDRGWEHDIDVESLLPNNTEGAEKSKLDSIFRSAPEIVNLAFSITSAGANLFTNFDDPMASAYSSMSYEEEKKARVPNYLAAINDDEMVQTAFQIAEVMKDEMATSRGEIAIIVSDELLFRRVTKFATDANKPIEILKQRGDLEVTKRAKDTGRFVVSMADYVGGLEFDGVVIIGVDEGRMPPQSTSSRDESKAYVTYASHNRLYVAISRARYRVTIMGTKERGVSPILANAFETEALIKE